MKKYLCLVTLAVFAFAGCHFSFGDKNSPIPSTTDETTSDNTDASVPTKTETPVSTEEIIKNLDTNNTSVIDGKVSGPFGDSDFIQISKTAELTGNITVPSSGKTYYISPDGRDSNDGTREKPFKTFGKTLTKLKPGDTLYVMSGSNKTKIPVHKPTLKCLSKKEGDIKINDEQIDVEADFAENIFIKNMVGSADAYITIAAAPGHSPVLAVSSDAIVDITNSSYLRISGLNLWGSTGDGAEGIQFTSGYKDKSNCNHIIIDNCDFKYINVRDKNFNGHGISMHGGSEKYPINNILIYNNKFQYLLTGFSECVTAVGNCEYINIIENEIDYTCNIGIDIGGHYEDCKNEKGSLCTDKDFVRYAYVANNKVSNELSAYDATAYGIYVDGGQHIQIINNTVTDCTGAFEVGAEEDCGDYPTADVLIKGNHVKNSVTDELLADRCHVFQIGGYDDETDGYVKDVRVEENDIYINAAISHAVFDFSKCQNVTIINNKFSATKSFTDGYVFEEIDSDKNIVIKDNDYNGIPEYDD